MVSLYCSLICVNAAIYIDVIALIWNRICLQNSWTMWLFTHDRSKPWEENQHSILTFNSVEEFWGLYHNIAQPSELPSGCDYSLFKVSVVMFSDRSVNQA